MSSPFPLLRLPRLVLFDVFKSLSIEEKIKLSFCSKKISIQINNARLYSQQVIVDLDCLNYKIRVRSENTNNIFDIFNCVYIGISNDPDIQQYQTGGRTVPVIPFTKGIHKHWKSQRKGFLSAIRHLLKMFYCKISTDFGYYNSDSFQPIISELFELQLEFKTLTIRPNGSKNHEFLWNQTFSKYGLVEDLSISSIADHDQRPVFYYWPREINITSFDRFTLESLLACTCTTIKLRGSHLENKDLDVVLRKWKAGGFPYLKYLYIEGQSITNNGTAILGMNPLEFMETDIHTDAGSKKATIRIGTGFMEMSVASFQ